MREFDGDCLIEEIIAAKSASSRFNALTRTLAGIGLETINYGVFAPQEELIEPEIRFLTTMRDDWMDYYYEANLAVRDSHVLRLRAGKLAPYIWGESLFNRLETPEKATALQGADAGLRSTLCVPLSGFTSRRPVGAINLGSPLPESEFRKIIQEHGTTLVAVSHRLPT